MKARQAADTEAPCFHTADRWLYSAATAKELLAHNNAPADKYKVSKALSGCGIAVVTSR